MPSARPPQLIAAANPGPLTGAGNNTWLLDGREPTLIDAGVGMPAHLAALETALGGRPLVRLLATHGHQDHVSGRGAIVARWPGVECWKFPEAGGDGAAWRSLTGGQQIAAGDRRLTVVATPGHAPDHVCFWDAEFRALYGGDMVTAGSSVMIPGGRGGSLRDYLASLQRLIALSPVVLYPGHGPVIDRPVAVMTEYSGAPAGTRAAGAGLGRGRRPGCRRDRRADLSGAR